MGDQRASVVTDLDEDDLASDLAEVVAKPTAQKAVDPTAIEKAARKSGFTNRTSIDKPKPRKRRKKSPFTVQLGIKARPGMKELFQDLGELIDEYDHTTFEKAILALIREEGAKDLESRFTELTSKHP